MPKSLQETFAPNNICFGCGVANPHGLQLRSQVSDSGDKLVAEFFTQPHHQAFPGVVNGGILGALLDCHMNWTSAWTLMREKGVSKPPCTVTAEFTVKLRKPTPIGERLFLEAWAESVEGTKVKVKARVLCADVVVCEGQGLFVAVDKTHPAHHRW